MGVVEASAVHCKYNANFRPHRAVFMAIRLRDKHREFYRYVEA